MILSTNQLLTLPNTSWTLSTGKDGKVFASTSSVTVCLLTLHIAVTVGECLEDPAENWYRTPEQSTPASMALGSCMVSKDGYCGTLDYFQDKLECWKSSQKCFDDAKKCIGDEKRTNKSPCQDMDAVCKQLLEHCTLCGATLSSMTTCASCGPSWGFKLRSTAVSCGMQGLTIDNPKA